MDKPREDGRSTDVELVEIAESIRDLSVELGAHELGADVSLTTIDCHARVLIADIPAALRVAESRGFERGIEEAAQFRKQVYRLLVEGYGPGGGYYEPDQRLGAAESLLTIGWGTALLSGNAAPQATPLEPRFEHTHAETFRDAQASREQDPELRIPLDEHGNCLACGSYAHGYAPSNGPAPIDMVLHCPACGFQHVDAPEPGTDWNNPPHKSHKCHRCGKVWRPADVPTNGVAAIKTRGKADTWPELRPHPPVGAPGEDPAKCEHAWEPHLWEPDSEYCPYCRSLRPRQK